MLGFSVGDVRDAPRAVVAFACVAHLQFHTEKALAVAVKNGLGLVVVIVDDAVAVALHVAGAAVGLGFVLVIIIGAVDVDRPVASAAGGVVVIEAALAQRDTLTAAIIACPNSRLAVSAQNGLGLQTAFTAKLAIELG